MNASPPDGPFLEPYVSRIAVLQYTSGTTGGLKAAQMSHANLVANAWQNNAWFAWSASDVVLGALPLCHTWGMGCVMNATGFLFRPLERGGAVWDKKPGERGTWLAVHEPWDDGRW